MNADVIVIGAGMVGSAIAYGLAGRGLDILLIDGGDRDWRAANANFGLVWSQGKGLDMPAYQHLTRDSIDLWSHFAAELEDAAALEIHYEQKGGLMICLGDAEFEERRAILHRLHNQTGGEQEWDMIDRVALEKLLPGVALGPEVSGAGLGHRDGHANPLRLLAALHRGFLRKGGHLRAGASVTAIRPAGRDDFTVAFGAERASAPRIVIAAGLGSKALAAQVGLDVPIHPQRGQILVTERCEPFLPLPMSGLRQTREGTVMIGATHDGTDLDTSTTAAAAGKLSATAIRRIPALANLRLVRQWAGLRILTPDGHPVYAQSERHPGAFVALCHSGVTLAAVHAARIADAIAAGALPATLDVFHQRRFDVPQTR